MKRKIIRFIPVVAGVAVLVSMLVYSYLNDQQQAPKSADSASIGKTIQMTAINGVNTVAPPSAKNSQTLYMVISPTCPYCRNGLKILQENRRLFDSLSMLMNIIPVFKEQTTIFEGQQMLADNNISLPVYRVSGCQVIQDVKFVPTFILVSNNLVENVATGGFRDAQDLKWMLEDLTKGFETRDNTIRQTTSFTCGLACMQMIMRDYAIDADSLAVARLLDLNPDHGTTMLQMKSVADAFGLSATGWSMNYEQLATIDLPAIAHMGGAHFVVIDNIGDNMISIRDPLGGKRELTKNDFESEWTGNLLEISRSTD